MVEDENYKNPKLIDFGFITKKRDKAQGRSPSLFCR